MKTRVIPSGGSTRSKRSTGIGSAGAFHRSRPSPSSTALPEPSASSAAEFQRRLAQLGFETVLIGALAALRYRASPRFTTDIDLLAWSLDGLAEAMERDGFKVTSMAEPGHEPYLVFIRGHGQAVDVMRAETAYQEEAMERAVDGVLTLEDVVIHKLLAWRTRDRDDIASILDAGHRRDDTYIRRWADAWGVLDRWESALREAH